MTVPTRHWSARYVGTPFAPLGRTFAGSDCWGLARLVYFGELGVVLPDYREGYDDPDALRQLGPLIAGESTLPPWRRLRPDATPAPLDLALFRRGAFESHVGVMVDARHMLHMDGEDCAKIVPVCDVAWGKRLTAYLRHDLLAGKDLRGADTPRALSGCSSSGMNRGANTP